MNSVKILVINSIGLSQYAFKLQTSVYGSGKQEKTLNVSMLICSCHERPFSARELHSELQLQVKYICVLLRSWEVA